MVHQLSNFRWPSLCYFCCGNSNKKYSTLDILHEISRLMPQPLTLSNFSYEEDKLLLLRGYASELNSVYSFVQFLEKSPLFNSFNIRLRYATKRKAKSGEVADFEIICSSKR